MSKLCNRLAHENERFPHTHLLYHEKIPVVFSVIPKVGCSTIKRWLIALTYPDALNDEVDVHQISLQNLALSIRPPEECAQILAAMPVLAFVRSPLERLRAAFIDKFVRPKTPELFQPSLEVIEDWSSQRRVDRSNVSGNSVDYDRRLTFREFVEYVAGSEEPHLDFHWRPQIAFLRDCTERRTTLPIQGLTSVLNSYTSVYSPTLLPSAPSNATRKESAGVEAAADIPAGILHNADLRPTLEELVDSRISDLIGIAFAEDLLLCELATSTDVRAIPGLDAVIASCTASRHCM